MPYKKYIPVNSDDLIFGGAAEVVAEETEHIKKWRGQDPQAGIALSGGGIRSASFSLGVLQAFAHRGWLPEFDYMSTVSGGGYIGSSLSYLLNLTTSAAKTQNPAALAFDVSQDRFPYQSCPMVDVPCNPKDKQARYKGGLLRRLRQNATYLVPGHGITWLSLIGVVLRNTAVSIIVSSALLVLVTLILIHADFISVNETYPNFALFTNKATCAAIWVFSTYVVLSFIATCLTFVFDRLGDKVAYRGRRFYERTVNLLLVATLVLLVIGALPWLYVATTHIAKNVALYAGAVTSLFGVASSLWAFLKSSGVKKPKIPKGPVVFLASALMLIGVVLLAIGIAEYLSSNWEIWQQYGAVFVTLLLFGLLPRANYVSLHRYYRDRLMEVFLPDEEAILNPDRARGRTDTGNTAMLGALCGVGREHNKGDKNNGPYHLINTNVVLVSSKNPRFRGRGGDNFVFSPLYSGSNATGWRCNVADAQETLASPGEGMTLATAMAISGAAVNPDAACDGEGITRQPILSVLMSLLNIRLGYWSANPMRAIKDEHSVCKAILKANMIYPGLVEIFGRRLLHERHPNLLLTDGGHFENLGLYELLRRRLKLIVVCDGSADPDYSFANLANALERARADFGALVDLNVESLKAFTPNHRRKEPSDEYLLPMADCGYVKANIKYAEVPSGSSTSNKSGELIYLTTTFFSALSTDLHGYRQAHPEFPDEPTSDQFFDERQFESYRELGFQTAWKMMAKLTEGNPTAFGGVHMPGVKDRF